mgnify:CR=1 FL=1
MTQPEPSAQVPMFWSVSKWRIQFNSSNVRRNISIPSRPPIFIPHSISKTTKYHSCFWYAPNCIVFEPIHHYCCPQCKAPHSKRKIFSPILALYEININPMSRKIDPNCTTTQSFPKSIDSWCPRIRNPEFRPVLLIPIPNSIDIIKIIFFLNLAKMNLLSVSYTHLRAHETREDLVFRIVL